MDGGGHGENISVAFETKNDFRTNLGQMITFHASGVKNEEVGILSPQALSSMITVGPDGSISSGGLPVGAYVSVAPPNGTNLGEQQVVITLQHLNNGMVDVCEELKQDYGNAVAAALASPTSHKVNGTTQFLNGGVQTQYINIQGLNGISQIMGIPTMGASSPVSNGNCAQTFNAVTHSASNVTGVTPHTTYTLQAMPQAPAAPQYIFANGQLLQGLQGTQIFIPQQATVAPQQQILTFPLNQNSNGQLVQLVMPNGQMVTATTSGNFQTMPTHAVAANSCNNSLQTQANLPGNFQGMCQTQVVPQILTNSAGQILAVSPQIIGQPSGLMQVYNNGQIQVDKQPVMQEASVQLPLNLTKNVITSTTGPSSENPSQPLIQIATVTDTSQVTSQSSQQSPETPNQIIQVTQTSSPSVTSTESSTPISQTSANTVDGINLEEIKEFAKAFKIRRLSLGLTQTQVGQALSITEGPAYSQSAICRFEKLDITPKSAQKIKPVLERWMKEAEERYKNGAQNLTEFIGTEPSKKRKRRTSFTPQALEILNQHFGRSTHPSGAEMTELADSLQYDREVVRVWFCNKRQTLKNAVKKLKTVSLTLVG